MKHGRLLKAYIIVTMGAVSLAGSIHLLRIAFHVPIIIGNYSVPLGLSCAGFAACIGVMTVAVYLFRQLSKND
jgi:hypothetical protein